VWPLRSVAPESNLLVAVFSVLDVPRRLRTTRVRLDRRHGRAGSFPGKNVGDRAPILPLRQRLLVDLVARRPEPSCSLGNAVTLHGPPLSWWRCHGVSIP
jgi:hypothetical protein